MNQETGPEPTRSQQPTAARVKSPWHIYAPLAPGSSSTFSGFSPALPDPTIGQISDPATTPHERAELALLGFLSVVSLQDISRVSPAAPLYANVKFVEPGLQQRQLANAPAIDIDWDSPQLNSQLERIATPVAEPQSKHPDRPETKQAASELRDVYKAVAKDLRDPQEIAHRLIDLGIDASKYAVEHLALPLLIAWYLKRSKSKTLQRTGEDVQRVTELYAKGVPLTSVNLQIHLHFDEERSRAALEAGCYIAEWHPAGLRIALDFVGWKSNQPPNK